MAIELFTRALELAKNVQGSQSAWSITHLNLGHAYRKSGSVSSLLSLHSLIPSAENSTTHTHASDESSSWIRGVQQRTVPSD